MFIIYIIYIIIMLRIAHPCLFPRRAHGPRTDAHLDDDDDEDVDDDEDDAHLDDVGAGEDQLLHHLTGDHVASKDGVVGELCPHLRGRVRQR